MNNDIYISIIIPAYNEELRICSTLEEIYKYMSIKSYNYEILIVDDGSEDKTIEVLNKYKSIFKYFKILKNDINMGKGYSVKKAMMEAKGDLKLFMDADNSVKISNLDNFINYINSGSDIVIGSIELGEGQIKDYTIWYRRVLGKLSKMLIRYVVTPNINDTQRGFKLFTLQASKIVFPAQTIYRWGFDIEILVIAIKNNLKISEVAVDWENSSGSSVNFLSYIQTLIELGKIKINIWINRY